MHDAPAPPAPSPGSHRGGQCVVSSFTRLDQGWLERFLEHRIADKRVLRLIQKWLSRRESSRTGNGRSTEEGRRKGHRFRRCLRTSTCTTCLTCGPTSGGGGTREEMWSSSRFADDYVAGFEHREDAERFLADLRERLAQFGLELHPEKTRLIEFGRFAAENRARRGDRKPETFDFLGFTHICAKTRNGRFKLKRITSKKKMRAKLRWSRPRSATPASLDPRTGTLACQRPGRALPLLRRARQHRRVARVPRGGHSALAQGAAARSQRSRMPWERMRRIADRWLPRAGIQHPWPNAAL